MGILVTDGVLPSGIPVSNVYVSFSGSLIYVEPKYSNDIYNVRANYKVFKDETKQLDTNISIPLVIEVSDISVGVYTSLYENLKQIYPNSVDC